MMFRRIVHGVCSDNTLITVNAMVCWFRPFDEQGTLQVIGNTSPELMVSPTSGHCSGTNICQPWYLGRDHGESRNDMEVDPPRPESPQV